MKYFAYGSNMCTGRLRAPNRVPSAQKVCIAKLVEHVFRFHKRSDDGSGKGDALHTRDANDLIWGVVFEIDPCEKPALDRAEGLGRGYVEKTATVVDQGGNQHEVFLYVAEAQAIDGRLRPYSWYKRFVVEGGRQHNLPAGYVDAIDGMPATQDPDQARDARMRAITC
jgi:hypothetical protein